jgi:hypothetical protein
VFYGRDRGETEQGKERFDHFLHYQNSGDMRGFDYILRTDGKWYVNCSDDGFVELDVAMEKDVA